MDKSIHYKVNGNKLMRFAMIHSSALLVALAIGCTGNVETTDDSVKTEIETPKVERGDAELDLDPRTDDDLDVDSPLPGDR